MQLIYARVVVQGPRRPWRKLVKQRPVGWWEVICCSVASCCCFFSVPFAWEDSLNWFGYPIFVAFLFWPPRQKRLLDCVYTITAQLPLFTKLYSVSLPFTVNTFEQLGVICSETRSRFHYAQRIYYYYHPHILKSSWLTEPVLKGLFVPLLS